jgi:hypothetical protein
VLTKQEKLPHDRKPGRSAEAVSAANGQLPTCAGVRTRTYTVLCAVDAARCEPAQSSLTSCSTAAARGQRSSRPERVDAVRSRLPPEQHQPSDRLHHVHHVLMRCASHRKRRVPLRDEGEQVFCRCDGMVPLLDVWTHWTRDAAGHADTSGAVVGSTARIQPLLSLIRTDSLPAVIS